MILVGVIALAALLRLPTLGEQSAWHDERNTLIVLDRSFSDMLGAVTAETTPPLFYVLAWAWLQVFGVTEVGGRSLSALAGLLTVPVAYAAGRVLLSRRAGLVFAALAATSPILVWYSQEGRPYTLLVLLVGVGFILFHWVP